MQFGLQHITLLDYPGKVACTIFCSGCNFRCPFCHNPDLVFGDEKFLDHSFSDILLFLKKRINKLDGICITGGEPFLHKEILQLAQYAKNMGYLVKIDTNGSFPEKLRETVECGIVDYIAMDIKNSPEKYEITSGATALEKVSESVHYLLQSRIDYEFRTTVTGNLHTSADFENIGKWITGAKHYFLQKFMNSGAILNGDGTVFEVSEEQMHEFKEIVKQFVPTVKLRGI